MRGEFYHKFLNMYWLRPENALITAVLAEKLNNLPQGDAILDLSCGDGTFMHTLLGGELAQSFDIFQNTGNLEKVRTNNADIFDHIDPSYAPKVTRQADRKINFGFDIKPSMLHKAKALGVYENLIEGDVSKGVAIDADSIDTIYVNHTINMYENLEAALAEIIRVLKPNGRAMISVYDRSILGFYKNLNENYPANFANRIERGMLPAFKHQMTLSEWDKSFSKAGFNIEKLHPLVSKEFVPHWCIGMRPVAPMMIKMVNSLRDSDGETLMDIKKDWITLFEELGEPYLQSPANPSDCATYLFELSKG